MDLKEIREKYPQYGDLSDEQLAKGLHAKFYADMPYDKFAQSIGITEKSIGRKVLDTIEGVGETITTGVTAPFGMVARAGATLGGIAGSIATGKYGTQEGAALAKEIAESYQRKFTYEPKTEAGKEALESLGKMFAASKLEGLGPTEALAVGATAGPAAQQAVNATRQAGGNVVRSVMDRVSPSPEMAGFGSAYSDDAAMRRARAAQLPVPIQLTKGQATRSFADQQFERETAKNPRAGEPLRQRFAEQNEKILQNFDAWVDQTGAEAGSLRATGEAVTNAIVKKSQKAKGEINAAYQKARSSGEMQEMVDAAPLAKYLADHEAEAINAPVLLSVQSKLAKLAKEGKVSVNDLEEIRKMVGQLSGKDATNAVFGNSVKTVIDGMTEGSGGELYKKARSLRQKYGQEFDDHAVVNRLLSFKPGTKDRAVAFEDVFGHSIMKGSLDDVRHMRKVLQTSGPEGMQAWKELQGRTVQHLKDEITSNVATDQFGNKVLSPAKLDRLVSELDKDGKLDLVFGKQGAQQIRDVNGIAKDVLTSPPGSVNHSNTASILIGLLDTAVSGTAGAPLPIGSAINYGVRKIKDRQLQKMVSEHLKEPE